MYFFRAFSILCAISTLIALVFWIGDKLTNMQFQQGWILVSSLFWMVVSWAVYRHLKKQHPES